MKPNIREMVVDTLALYGASLSKGNFIEKQDKVFALRVSVKGKRIRIEQSNGDLIFSGPIKPSAVSSFVEDFWFWKRLENNDG